MVYFHPTYLSLVALLFSHTVVAAPMHNGVNPPPPPPAPYEPKVGDVAHIKPIDTTANIFGPGANVAHPHVIMGKDLNENTVVAPVSHGWHPESRPFMPAGNDPLHPALNNAQVGLKHIVTKPGAVIEKSGGILKDVTLSNESLQKIYEGKLNVQAHDDAATAHGHAATAHAAAEQAHLAAANAHKGAKTVGGAAADHLAEAARHKMQSEYHITESNEHKMASKEVTGPNLDAYNAAHDSRTGAVKPHNDALHSTAHATAARANIAAATQNKKAADVYTQIANSPNIPNEHRDKANAAHDAQRHTQLAADHMAKAKAHAPSSQNKPHPGESRGAAVASHNAAVVLHNAAEKHGALPAKTKGK